MLGALVSKGGWQGTPTQQIIVTQPISTPVTHDAQADYVVAARRDAWTVGMYPSGAGRLWTRGGVPSTTPRGQLSAGNQCHARYLSSAERTLCRPVFGRCECNQPVAHANSRAVHPMRGSRCIPMAPGTVVHMQVHLQFPWRVYGEWVEHRTSLADVGTVCNPDHVLKLKRSVGRCRLSGMDQPTGRYTPLCERGVAMGKVCRPPCWFGPWS